MATENKNLSSYKKEQLPDVKNKTIGIITSQWNGQVTENMREGAVQTLLDCGVIPQHIIQWNVPGSFELINGAKRMLTLKVDAIIVIGCVIQGETRHFDFVCQGVTSGIAYLNASQEIPVIFCVLTDNTLQQSLDRSGGKYGNKGIEAAITAIKMIDL
ncbi:MULTISPECIES: 6,7-dimethyl-8-ribityllumazine synthase [unclassified Capnocytophaga]|jgi:6,7-dimethyl-8-ribityllumazine synthase|uniref:6,7-dimethyl-8-ribityllumazine synthase n=1 Tax=unclassified Capnocytophaga TaxID=2640652 RepID=UPI000202BFEC|nr:MULTISPECIES: 6,7-dimethyl-8-ribityllumazine synthase [unclassified Capnocytophaga]EGD34652.1 6,7-dimethyl-8-ribityllumazine synthase (riboflavin synthase beta chain) [Capnocytophaga sp. oral taxon 338 str. F0234]MEB3005079.1 6,7-dimethyl-8-ribityllumazine synthase [Capnocytophaga sp. G2]